jgi:nucleoside-diphosphate-sugar epimerase
MAEPIIVTGAAGFIGRNVVAELNARGEDELILVDELGVSKPGESEKWKNLVGFGMRTSSRRRIFWDCWRKVPIRMRAR